MYSSVDKINNQLISMRQLKCNLNPTDLALDIFLLLALKCNLIIEEVNNARNTENMFGNN